MQTVFLDFKENDLWLCHAVFLSSLDGLHQELKLPTHCPIVNPLLFNELVRHSRCWELVVQHSAQHSL